MVLILIALIKVNHKTIQILPFRPNATRLEVQQFNHVIHLFVCFSFVLRSSFSDRIYLKKEKRVVGKTFKTTLHALQHMYSYNLNSFQGHLLSVQTGYFLNVIFCPFIQSKHIMTKNGKALCRSTSDLEIFIEDNYELRIGPTLNM